MITVTGTYRTYNIYRYMKNDAYSIYGRPIKQNLPACDAWPASAPRCPAAGRGCAAPAPWPRRTTPAPPGASVSAPPPAGCAGSGSRPAPSSAGH